MPTDLEFFFRVREKQVPWGSIIIGYLAGIIASLFFTPLIGIAAAPSGLFGAEYLRLRDSRIAFVSTRAWMTGWGVTIAVRIAIGVVMIGLWMIWAWLNRTFAVRERYNCTL
jgi:hypothetical protein